MVAQERATVDTQHKLELLGRAAQYDDRVSAVGTVQPETPSGSFPLGEDFGLFAPPADCSDSPDVFPHISHVTTPSGRRLAVLKILQTSACHNDCRYCAFRAGRDFRRASFTPDELARAFDLMQRAGVVQGMFLSSGIVTTSHSMDEMLVTTELLRERYRFRGYIHLKILPGAEAAQIARAVELADRVSVNLEGPTSDRLATLAPRKRMEELVGPLRVAARFISGHRRLRDPKVGYGRLGMSTQFVVGPAGESDRELLGTAQRLYKELRLSRAYYSAFNPVVGTPLENEPPTDPRREVRLYQADWLLRYYGFSVEDLPFDASGQLDQAIDPKTAWAKAHPEHYPVEVNRAPLPDLLRVPGIGPASARAILAARRQGALQELGDLRRLGARVTRASPYVLLAGKRPPCQLPLL
jgi:predicted DNA-binding helix-hairpin-helix protein